jgi:hypothetical protein
VNRRYHPSAPVRGERYTLARRRAKVDAVEDLLAREDELHGPAEAASRNSNNRRVRGKRVFLPERAAGVRRYDSHVRWVDSELQAQSEPEAFGVLCRLVNGQPSVVPFSDGR